MNYAKLTPEKFLEKLKAGEYESLTGARRGIGKADWSDADKDAARAKAEKHFGGAPTSAAKPAKKTATKKAPAVKTAAVKAVKAKVGRKAAAAAQGEDKPEIKPPPIGQDHYSDILTRAKNVTMADVRKNPHAIIQLATHGVQAGTSVLNTLAALKQQDPTLNISDSVDAANNTVKASLHLTSLVLDNLSDGLEGRSSSVHDRVTEIAPEPLHTEANGVAEPVKGTPTYEAPTTT